MEKYHKNSVLITHLRDGNEDAYTFLVSSYSKRLLAYAITLVNDTVLAEDILQNVFFKVWKGRNKLNAELSLKNYLFKMVYNEFIDQYRKKQYTLPLDEKYHIAIEKTVDSIKEDRWERIAQLINEEIEKLPEKCKEVFILSKKKGLTNYEISEYLGISIKTVEWHITKAFKTLKSKLNRDIKNAIILTV